MDIIAFTIVCLVVERRIMSSLTSDTGLNDVLVHGFVCRSQ